MTWKLRRTMLFFSATCLAAFASAQTSNSVEIERHIQRVEAGLLPDIVVVKAGSLPVSEVHTLKERMAEFQVPGVSIAVVHHGQLEWARGFGVTALGGSRVNAGTLFQAGSISKPIAALAALRLVEDGKLSLDNDVNQSLKSWKIPASQAAAGKPVTLRELLTHTGGMSVHGFPGYADGAPVPALVQVLNGERPANTAAIVVETQPGTRWNYSGGGFAIVQQLLIDASHQTFPRLLHDTVLAPIGMTQSAYQQPLVDSLKMTAALPYDGDGKPIPGGPHTYPEMAAAGLWTTPTDLAKYIIEVQTSLAGKSNHVLSQLMTKQMVTPGMGQWGLGLEIGGSAPNPYFSHGGVNEGYESLFVGYEASGDGAVVMTNAAGGSRIAEEIMRSIAAEYGWPDWKPTTRQIVDVDLKTLTSYVGSYTLSPDADLVITLEGSHLEAQATGQAKVSLDAESSTVFSPGGFDVKIEFVKGETGSVNGIVMHSGGHEMKAPRKVVKQD